MLVCAGIGIGIFLLLGKKEWVEKTSLEVVVLVGVVAIFVVALTVCFLIHGIRRYVRRKGKPSGKV
jgi:hypothetical protein